MGTYSDIGKTN